MYEVLLVPDLAGRPYYMFDDYDGKPLFAGIFHTGFNADNIYVARPLLVPNGRPFTVRAGELATQLLENEIKDFVVMSAVDYVRATNHPARGGIFRNRETSGGDAFVSLEW